MQKISHILAITLSFVLHIFCCGLPLLALILTSASFSSALSQPIFDWVHQFHIHILVVSTGIVLFALLFQIKATQKALALHNKLRFFQIKGFKLTCISVTLLLLNFVWLYFEPYSHLAH